ncbi:hypothetical protein VIBNISO65_680020 [Vibrio nigripulchritudo SO65]|nr:hypothetical protein VIBNIAM115_1530021 [Vibrio nigripulchritudo AM115]CCN40600.1 hypothetical protein VIBNIFTn2_1340063 [Vibrio nigripulchritudo FTn2]CCN66106.1 hypothetical protein VIBNIPon4_50021 [Vibrio nigripulchritudo POn4]CCN78596.1 hypothetical protein VIBNISO65_680020 [Vibrio nigripulchritudo SO65]
MEMLQYQFSAFQKQAHSSNLTSYERPKSRKGIDNNYLILLNFYQYSYSIKH